MTQAPAGWYPQSDGTQRYWDGSAWTENVAQGPALAVPPTPTAPSAQPLPSSSGEIQAPPALAEMPASPPPLGSALADLPGYAPMSAMAAKPTRRVWPWILGIGGSLVVLGVLAVIAVVVIFAKTVSDPKGVVEDFNTAYFSGDCETYVDLTTAAERETDGFPGTCAEVTAGFFPEVDKASFSITLDGVEISGSSATVAGTIASDEYGDGSLTYHLVKVDGKWKVDSID